MLPIEAGGHSLAASLAKLNVGGERMLAPPFSLKISAASTLHCITPAIGHKEFAWADHRHFVEAGRRSIVILVI
jgi:hypothetical protein